MSVKPEIRITAIVGCCFLKRADQFHAIHLGHLVIGDHYIEALLAAQFKRFDARVPDVTTLCPNSSSTLRRAANPKELSSTNRIRPQGLEEGECVIERPNELSRAVITLSIEFLSDWKIARSRS